MVKILFISNTANFSKFNRPYMNWCSEQGWQVDYCAPDDEVVYGCRKHYVLQIPRSPFSFKLVKCIYELEKILSEEKYDIIHCHTPTGAVIARLAARKLFRKNKVQVVYTAHGFHFYKGAPLVNWLCYYPVEKYLARYTNVLVTINLEDYSIAKRKLKCIKNIHYMHGVGVDFSKFFSLSPKEKEELRIKNGFSKDDFILLYTAEFIHRKNHQLIFDIIPDLVKSIPNLKVIFAGKGVLLEYYRNYVKEYHLQNVVSFTGYTKDVDVYCKMSDILLMPSLQEGLPISMIEALGTGLPVVCSKIRGHTDVIENGSNGFLCDLTLKEEFADRIVELYGNRDLMREMSNNNINKSSLYSVDIAVAKMSDVYRSCLEKRL